MPEERDKKLVLIDGMAILHRAYHAYPLSLTTPTGELINAVYGFTAILLNVIEKIKPTHVIVTWDTGKPTFRHSEYTEYKATREKPDDELIGQIARTQEVVTVLNMPQFGVEGYEADDVIGTLASQATNKSQITNNKLQSDEPAAHLDNVQVIIVTGDKDSLQLVNEDKVIVYMPPATGRFAKDRGPQIIDEVAFKAKYNLDPAQMVDLKALMGDPSDNIPGVKGIGPKTATKLLVKLPTLERIYSKLDETRSEVVEIVGERVVGLLEKDRAMAELSKKLATIEKSVPIKLDWKACQLNDYDREAAIKLFEELQFKSLINRLPKDDWEENLEDVFQ